MYIVEKKNGVLDKHPNLVSATGDYKKDGVAIYQQINFIDYSRYRYEIDDCYDYEEDDNVVVVIKNLDDEYDERNCGPEGWYNIQECMYEAPDGFKEKDVHVFLKGLGMKEGWDE